VADQRLAHRVAGLEQVPDDGVLVAAGVPDRRDLLQVLDGGDQLDHVLDREGRVLLGGGLRLVCCASHSRPLAQRPPVRQFVW